MYDDFRDDAAASFYEDEQPKTNYQTASGTTTNAPQRRGSRFLGMTSIQRLVLAVMLMFAVCVIGALFLFVTGKIAF